MRQADEAATRSHASDELSRAASRSLDRAAIEVLYVELERPLFNVVYRWLWNPDDAIEVVQEAFVRLHQRRGDVDPTTAKAFVYRIALNLASNRRRSRRLWRWVGLERESRGDGEGAAMSPVHDELLISGDSALPTDALETKERARMLQESVEALGEKHRRVVMLTELAGLSYRDVANILEIPEGTVASRRNHALAQLRTALAARGMERLG